MKVNHGWIFLMIIATLTIAMAGVGQSSTATMTLDPSEVKDIDPGGTFNVDVTVADVSNLFGWQFLIRFDSRVLRVDNVTEGQFLGSTGEETLFVGPTMDNDKGFVIAGATFLPTVSWPEEGVTGNGVLATITFGVTGRGTTTLRFDKDQSKLTTVILGNKVGIDYEETNGAFSNGTPEILSVSLIIAIVVAVAVCSVGAFYLIRRRRT
jgi:hypothetical protein